MTKTRVGAVPDTPYSIVPVAGSRSSQAKAIKLFGEVASGSNCAVDVLMFPLNLKKPLSKILTAENVDPKKLKLKPEGKLAVTKLLFEVEITVEDDNVNGLNVPDVTTLYVLVLPSVVAKV